MRYNRRHYERLRDTDHAEELVEKIYFLIRNNTSGNLNLVWKDHIRYLIFSYLDVIKTD